MVPARIRGVGPEPHVCLPFRSSVGVCTFFVLRVIQKSDTRLSLDENRKGVPPKRKATEILVELQQDQEPVLFTQHGRPAAYPVDVEAFEALNQRVALLDGNAKA
jgi:prevent-host-death family protein